MNRHARRKVPRPNRAQAYATGLQKVWNAQRPTPEEARELKRHRLADGTYPLPAALDPVR